MEYPGLRERLISAYYAAEMKNTAKDIWDAVAKAAVETLLPTDEEEVVQIPFSLPRPFPLRGPIQALRTRAASLSSSDQQPTTGETGVCFKCGVKSPKVFCEECRVEQPPEQEKDDERPGYRQCAAKAPSGFYLCTGILGHHGPHIAWRSIDKRVPLEVWPERRGAGSDRRKNTERRKADKFNFSGRRDHSRRRYRGDGTDKDNRRKLLERRKLVGRRAGDQ